MPSTTGSQLQRMHKSLGPGIAASLLSNSQFAVPFLLWYIPLQLKVPNAVGQMSQPKLSLRLTPMELNQLPAQSALEKAPTLIQSLSGSEYLKHT